MECSRDQETGDQKSHFGFSALEKEEVRDRWQRGESLKAIGRVFGKPSSSIYYRLSPYGGIRPARGPGRDGRPVVTVSPKTALTSASAAGGSNPGR
jgi:hypothetical protein